MRKPDRRWLPPILIAGAYAFSLAAYARLPERVPIHWNVAGQVESIMAEVDRLEQEQKWPEALAAAQRAEAAVAAARPTPQLKSGSASG